MKRKGLMVTIVVLCCIIVMLLIIMFLFTIPSIKTNLNTENLESANVENTILDSSLENEVFDTVVEMPEIMKTNDEIVEGSVPNATDTDLFDVMYSEYKSSNGNVNIIHPIINGIEDENLKTKINDKIKANALSIVKLFPVSTALQKLELSSQILSITEDKVSIIYTGSIIGYTFKENTNKNNNNNYSFPQNNIGSTPQNSMNNLTPISPNGLPNTSDSGIPLPNSYNFNGAPNNVIENPTSNSGPMGSVTAYSNTYSSYRKVNVDYRIFFTNVINMKDGSDISLSSYINPMTLANYTLSDKAEIVDCGGNDEKAVRKYIKSIGKEKLTEIFEMADFSNKTLKKWPKSFSYVEDGYLYYTVKVKQSLGTYVLFKYNLNS